MVLGTEGGLPAEQGLLGRPGDYLSHRLLSIYFPETWYPGLGKGGKEGLCMFVGVLRGVGSFMKTVSHYSKSV